MRSPTRRPRRAQHTLTSRGERRGPDRQRRGAGEQICVEGTGDTGGVEAREWRGHWWLPGDEDAHAGRLALSDDGHLRLDLVGRLKLTSEDETIVLGETNDGPFTLLHCRGGGKTLGRVTLQTITVGGYIRGVHLASSADRLFSATTVRIEYLLGFMGARTAFSIATKEDDDAWTGAQSATASPGDVSITVDGLDLTFRIEHERFGYRQDDRSNVRKVAAREGAALIIRSPTPTTYDAFQAHVKSLMDLLTLTAHAPAGLLSQQLSHRTDNPDLGEMGIEEETSELYVRQTYRPKPTNDAANDRTQYLFTLDDLDDPAAALIRWFSLRDRTWLACGMLFGLRYVPEGYTQSRLMTSVAAAEALHRELFPGATALQPEAFDRLQDTVRRALAGATPEAKAMRHFAKTRLGRNEPACKERLMELAAVPDETAVKKLIADVPRWAKLVRDGRDGVAHASRDALEFERTNSWLYPLEINIMLFSLVLMQKIGVPAEVQQRAVRAQHIWYIVDKFNEAGGA